MKHIHGGDVYSHRDCIDFSANCNPLGTPQSVKEAILRQTETLFEYPEVGSAALCRRIAEYESTAPESVICGNGAAEVIYSLIRARMPKKALIPAPTFAEYEQALQSVDCEVIYHFLVKDKGFVIDSAFVDAVEEDIDMIFLCNPNNPTGTLTDRDVIEKLLHKCEEHNILLVLDECFLDFVQEGQKYSFVEQCGKHPQLFILKAFTKRCGMAGIRLGYGISGNRRLLCRMEQMTQPWNVSSVAQAAGLAALQETEFIRRGLEITAVESEFLKKELSELGYQVYDAKANYIFFEAGDTLYEDCLKEGFLIRDCSNYPGLGKGYYRIAIKLHEENRKLTEALKRIERNKING